MAFKMKPVIQSNIKGLDMTQKHVASIIWRKPILTFTMVGQAIVNEKGEFLPDADITEGTIKDVPIAFHFQIDPKKVSPAHQNRLAAARDRLNAAQSIIEKFAAAQGAERPNLKVTHADLPDTDLLVEIYGEQDEAADDRLLAVVMTDPEDGTTLWDYVDESGNTPKLTREFLTQNPRVGEAMQKAFGEWYFSTKASSEAATKAKPANGSTDTTLKTPIVSSTVSDGESTAPETNAAT